MSTEFRGVARDPWTVQGLGCLWAAALIVAVVAVMNAWLLFSGESMQPSLEVFVRWSLPLAVPLGGAFALAAWRLGVKSRLEVVVELHEDGTRTLRVGDAVSETGLFLVRRGWDHSVGGRGLKIIWCDVERDGELLVRFSKEVGALIATPAGWAQAAPPMGRPAKHGGFVVDEVVQLASALRLTES